MEKGKLQKINNKKSKEGMESYSKDGYHCILTKYVSCTEVYVMFDDGETKKTRFERFKNSEFCKYSSNSSDSWTDTRMNGVKRVPTELLVKDFLEELSFRHQDTLSTKQFKNNLIYSNTPGAYLYDFINRDLKIIIEIDGRSHNNIEAQRIDRNKEMLAYLQGFKVFRFKNEYVKNNTEDFKNEVRAILKGVVV